MHTLLFPSTIKAAITTVKKIIVIHLIAVLMLVSCDQTQSDTNSNQKSLLTTAVAESKNPASLPIFDETSITREFLNKHNGLKWENFLGDWIDRNGELQGNKPWATANINRKTTGPISLDVTELVNTQQGKKNQLMIFSATIPVKIASKDSDHSPILKILSEDGSFLELKPNLDCYVARSTFKNINSDVLTFDSKDHKAFIQFELPKKKFKKATLEIWPIIAYGSGQIEVYSLAPQKEKLFSSKKGIANSFLSFNELEGHPDVIFVDTFDGPKIKPEWYWQRKLRKGQVNNGHISGDVDPERKDNSAINIRYFFAKHIKEEPTEIFFRYSIRFHKDFIYATQGGKLPGQSGTYNTCGWGGRTPSDTCRGWSARMHFKLPIKAGPYIDMIPIGTYLYHLGQEGKYGDAEMWQAFCKMEQWCELEQYVKLNTPGKDDGILRGYHNGMLVFERKDVRYRNDSDLKIEDVWTLVYHGGTALPTEPITADIDNVVISRTYIGLLKESDAKIELDKKNLSVPASNMGSSGTDYRNVDHSIKPRLSNQKISFIKKKLPIFNKNSLLQTIPGNTVVDLGNFSCTNPSGDTESCSKVTDYSGIVYDQNHHQVLLFGGGHATTFTDTVFLFDFKTLRWTEDYPPTPCTSEFMNEANFSNSPAAWIKGPSGPYPRPMSRHTYDHLVVATNLPELIMLIGPNGRSRPCPPGSWYSSGNPKVAHYLLEKKSWEFSETAETDGRPFYNLFEYTAAEYDPVSGMIILVGRYGLYLYNPYNRTKTRLLDNTYKKSYSEDIGYANELVYFPPYDRMYYFNRNSHSVWEVKLDRSNLAKSTVEKISTTGDYPKHNEPGFAYDSANGVIGGAVNNNKFYIFDPKTKAWSNQVVSGGTPGKMEFHNIIYNPVDNIYIFLTKGFKTWAYRYK